MTNQNKTDLFDFLLELADDALIHGHRLSEWCGHAPVLEEDLALANIALDHIGRANALYGLAAKVEGGGRSADDLAFLRDPTEFRNTNIVELPRGDFAFTVLRLFLSGQYNYLQFRALTDCDETELAGISGRSVNESTYHLRHSSAWLERLGRGTEESKRRLEEALADLWPYTSEYHSTSAAAQRLMGEKMIPDLSGIFDDWLGAVRSCFDSAALEMPEAPDSEMRGQGRSGLHTEHLGHLLAEMQILQRSFPGAKW